MVPWKKRSLYIGQEQEHLEGDAKENTVLEGPGIKMNQKTPDFHMYHHWSTKLSDSVSMQPKENGLQVFFYKPLFKIELCCCKFHSKDDKEIKYDCTYDAT